MNHDKLFMQTPAIHIYEQKLTYYFWQKIGPNNLKMGTITNGIKGQSCHQDKWCMDKFLLDNCLLFKMAPHIYHWNLVHIWSSIAEIQVFRSLFGGGLVGCCSVLQVVTFKIFSLAEIQDGFKFTEIQNNSKTINATCKKNKQIIINPDWDKKDFMFRTRPITMRAQPNLFEVVLLCVFIVVGVVLDAW